MLVHLGVILATTVAVLYAILTQPRTVAIGAIVIGLSALIATATPPRIRGGRRYRGSWVRNLLPFLPLMTSGATAEEEYEPEEVNAVPPRPSYLSRPRHDDFEQVQTVGGCECKPVSSDPANGHTFAESVANDHDGPGWCDVEPGCRNAIDAEPGYDGWDNVVRDPGPLSAVAVRQPPASEEWYRPRLTSPSTAILPTEERRALVRGARVIMPSADNTVAVRPPRHAVRPHEGRFSIPMPPRENPFVVRSSNPGSGLGTMATAATGLFALAGTKHLHRKLNEPAIEPRHPLFERYEFTEGTTESGTAGLGHEHNDAVVLVSLVGGTGPVQVHITNSRLPPPWDPDVKYKAWTAAAGDERAYGYTKDDARAKVGPGALVTEGVANVCCATLLRFYAPGPAVGDLASTNIELQIEGGMAPDDLAVARLSNFAQWNSYDRSCVIAIRPPSRTNGPLYIHVVSEPSAANRTQLYTYWVSIDHPDPRRSTLDVIAAATDRTMRKANEYFRDATTTRKAMGDHPSLSLGQLVQTTEQTSIPITGQVAPNKQGLTFELRKMGRAVNSLIREQRNMHDLFTEDGNSVLQNMVTQARDEFTASHSHVHYGRDKETNMVDHGRRVKLLHAIHEVKIRRKFIISIIQELPDSACVYGGKNDCTTHPVRVAEESMNRKLRRESGVWNRLTTDGQVATRLDINGMVASFRDFYDKMYPDGDILTLPFPAWVVSEDGIEYDRDNEAKNILYHMTHTIILPFLIPILEVRPLAGDDPQDAILQAVYGDGLGDHIQAIVRIRRAELQP